jgi:hypothetical protein
MKKGRVLNWFSPIVIVLVFIMISSCEKNSKFDKSELLGTWASTDLVDNLDFKSENDLYKNGDHFNYSLSGDSITIQYNGILYILVKPTTHSFKLHGNELTIDFRPSCYGFRQQEIRFIRN